MYSLVAGIVLSSCRRLVKPDTKVTIGTKPMKIAKIAP